METTLNIVRAYPKPRNPRRFPETEIKNYIPILALLEIILSQRKRTSRCPRTDPEPLGQCHFIDLLWGTIH